MAKVKMSPSDTNKGDFKGAGPFDRVRGTAVPLNPVSPGFAKGEQPFAGVWGRAP